MFGNTGNTSFGSFITATQSSPFGATSFGKPISTTTGFGNSSAPAFGSNNTLFSAKPAGTTTGGLFGNATAAPVFGQPATTQSSFGGFATSGANTSLFGTQQNANSSIFGSAGTTSAFGQTQKPAAFGFGSSTGTSLFGQPQQPVQQTTPFGQMNNTANTSLFGNPGAFRAGTTGSGITGTGLVKFSPVTGTDTMVKNGATQNISTRHHCIMCMKEYETKSLEELRLEDYQAGLKGSQQAGQTPGLFGAPAQASPFGNTGAITSTGSTGFGSMTGGFVTNNQSTTSGGLFGKPVAGFGTPATTTSAFAFNSAPSTGLFGANTQNKPFGTATSTTLFSNANTNQTTTGFGGLNNAQTSSFGFGATQPNQSLSLFNQNKPAFNMAPATSNTGFSFGQTTPASTSNSLFGGNKPLGTTGFGTGTTGFGATATPAFGTTPGFGATPNTSTSLFNTSFKPATQNTGFSFGTTPSATSTLGGNTGLNLGGGSSLFGQNKPGGSLFGTPSATTTFNSLGTFGNTTGFGTNTNTNTGLGMNLLGAGGGLGGAGGVGGLGAGGGIMGGGLTNSLNQNPTSVPVHQQILALVSAPFGDSPLLKNLLPASGKTEEILKPANNTNKTLNNPQFKVSTTSSPKVKARVVTPAQLSKKSLFEGLEEEDPTLLEAFQPRSNAKRLVLRPKLVASSPVVVSEDNLNTSRNSETIESTEASPSLPSPQIEPVDKENYQGVCQPADRRSSSTSWLKKKVLTKHIKMREEEFDGQKSPFNSSEANEDALENTVAEFRNTGSSSKNQSNLSVNASLNCSLDNEKSINDSLAFNDSSRELDESAVSSVFPPETEVQNAGNVVLRRAGYYTIPPVDQLDEYVHGESCVVPNFTIGRKGYGNVYFPDSFDIYGLNLDEIVYFRHKEVVIYPDDDKKPPVGQGLNRRAQVTLDRVWPQDKNLHEPITDPHRLVSMNYEGKLRRVSAKHDTRFLEYRPETGSWVFKVDHFSKYGLSDSDDEDGDLPLDPSMKRLKAGEIPSNFLVPGRGAKKKSVSTLKQVQMPNELSKNEKTVSEANGEMMDIGNEETMNKSPNSSDISKEKQSALSPTSIYARLAGTDSHKLQLMKASFFHGNDDYSDVLSLYGSDTHLKPYNIKKKEANFQDIAPTKSQNYKSMFTMHRDMSYDKLPKDHENHVKQMAAEETKLEKSSENLSKYLPALVVNPSTVVLKFRCEVIPLRESVSNKLKFQCIADIGIQMGRKFKPNWGPGLTLLSLSTREQASVVPLQNKFSQIEIYMTGRLLGDNTSSSIVQRLQILGGNRVDSDYMQVFRESIEGHLRIQLNHCVIGHEGGNCPWIRVDTREAGLNALHDHSNLSGEFLAQNNPDHLTSYANDVWKLCVALWGKLPSIQPDSNAESHENVMIRREAFGDWLKEVVEPAVQNEIADIKIEDALILSLLSANKLEEACAVARKIGDYNLALLISQLGGSSSVRELIKQTIALWQATEVLNNISMNRLKVYMLAAGTHLIMCNDETVNVCEGLDWKRSLAIHLWYLSASTASITDVLELYESSFNTEPAEVYAAPPLPEYKEEDFEAEIIGGKMTYDLSYHLIKLYCSGNHSLEELLNPLTHTSDPLDYRLSWLLQQVVVGLGYSHLSDHVAAMTHTNFAAQLEAHGLWHWAIFVDLHLNDLGTRKKAVLDLLERYVQIDESSDYVRRETFLIEKLGISSMWINEAKAVKALAMKRYGEAAWYLLQAEQWNRAHTVIIEYLAADAVINENYEYLRSLLTPLVRPEAHNVINGWTYQGQLLWDYMEIAMEIERFIKSADYKQIGYQLELLQPQLSSLCTKINKFPCPTAKLRLCQAEIAKRTLHLARTLLLKQPSEDRSTTRVLVHLVSQLPLPEDYAQQELRPLISMCVNEIVGH